jgi:hypothetical protein
VKRRTPNLSKPEVLGIHGNSPIESEQYLGDNAHMECRHSRKPIFIVLLVGIVTIVAVSWWHSCIEREGRRRLDTVVDEISARDPRWRATDLLADQPEIPANENCALMVARFWQMLGEYRRFEFTAFGGLDDPRVRDPNRLLAENVYLQIDTELEGTEATWPEIERISRSPRGRIQRTTEKQLWNSYHVLEQRPDGVSRFLDWRCELLVRDRQPERAVTAMLALLNLARLEGYTVSRDAQGRQHYELCNLCRRVERLLALGPLDGRIAKLQSELMTEAEADRLRSDIRILRADYDRFFRACDCGEDSLAAHLGESPSRTPTLETRVRTWTYRPHRYEDWAEAISYFTGALTLADLPDHQQLAALVSLPTPPADDLHPFSRNCPTFVQTAFEQALLTKALLRSSFVALAAERYRLLTGEWPPSIEAIPKSILPAVPLDPFSGTPLLMTRRPDGITIYAVGLDGFDDGGAIRYVYPLGKRTGDIGFRLYDLDKRRLPPL